jgi:hypothetical protein
LGRKQTLPLSTKFAVLQPHIYAWFGPAMPSGAGRANRIVTFDIISSTRQIVTLEAPCCLAAVRSRVTKWRKWKNPPIQAVRVTSADSGRLFNNDAAGTS